MFHKVKSVSPLPNYKLSVGFSEGIVKLYDIKPLFEKIPAFTYLKEHPEEFACVSVDVGGYGISGAMNWTCPVMNYGSMVSRSIHLLMD